MSSTPQTPSNRPEIPPSRRSLPRQVALVAFVFVATLAILVGIAAVLREPSTVATTSTVPPEAAASVGIAGPSSSGPPSLGESAPPGSPSPEGSGDPILIGAGDIAACDRDDDAQTAALLVDQPGTVFTAGDNVYPSGTAAQFAECYGPTWGRELARTWPTPGNHDHETADLAGYLGYFGDAASPDGTTWYSHDIGTWHVIALDATCVPAGGCGPESAQIGRASCRERV